MLYPASSVQRLRICLLLLVVTLVVFLPVVCHPFVVLDDETYVVKNSHIHHGISLSSLKWAFTSTEHANWHPLTWISHELDCQLFGLNPHGHHATNLVLHAATVLLLFLLMDKITGSRWKSAFVAALFAIHPLHVESVAWVAERKDVLSAFFWMLTMLAYVRYTEKPGWKRYSLVMLSFALGLLSKPMLVSMPLVLLLLDYWPLGRLQTADHRRQAGLGKLVQEKTPLFLMSAASCAVTYYAEKLGGAMGDGAVPIPMRIGNAMLACWRYIGKMLWPSHLSVLYPYNRHSIPTLWPSLIAGLALVVVTVLLLRMARRRPYLAVGWLWYLITLIPVIGLVQVGEQTMADRYTYIPLIGVFIMIAWGIPELFGQGERVNGRKGEAELPTPGSQRSTPNTGRRTKTCDCRSPINHLPALPVVAFMMVVALAICARVQVGYWKDSIALFQHAVAVTQDNYSGHCYLAWALENADRTDEAVEQYRIAEKISPNSLRAHVCIAFLLSNEGRYEEAWEEVKISRELGYNPNPRFITYLRAMMGDG